MRRITYVFLLAAGCADAPGILDAEVPVTPAHLESSPPPSTSPARAARAPTAPPRAHRPPPLAGQAVSIPAGTLRVGSRPGWAGRNPRVEADLVEVTLPAFDIDALPYPNDPGRPPELAATRAEAARMCEAQGRRLCHELEWERACRGDGVDPFPTGEHLDLAACLVDPQACPSSMGVFDLGIRTPEWTASDAEEWLAHLDRTAVVRGARPEHSQASHRCGSRLATSPQGGGRELAFRCCGGEAPGVAYPEVGPQRAFRDLELDDERWRAILSSVPEVARFADDFEAYGEPVAARALARGGATAETVTWDLAPVPFAWAPTPGEEVWIVTGQSGDASVLIALYTNPDETFHHAASFVFAEPAMPIAILRTPADRRELLWTTCWSCGGENGTITLDENARILIAQR